MGKGIAAVPFHRVADGMPQIEEKPNAGILRLLGNNRRFIGGTAAKNGLIIRLRSGHQRPQLLPGQYAGFYGFRHAISQGRWG